MRDGTAGLLYVDPPAPMFRYNGQPAIGLAVSMAKNGDALALGEHIVQPDFSRS